MQDAGHRIYFHIILHLHVACVWSNERINFYNWLGCLAAVHLLNFWVHFAAVRASHHNNAGIAFNIILWGLNYIFKIKARQGNVLRDSSVCCSLRHVSAIDGKEISRIGRMLCWFLEFCTQHFFRPEKIETLTKLRNACQDVAKIRLEWGSTEIDRKANMECAVCWSTNANICLFILYETNARRSHLQ